MGANSVDYMPIERIIHGDDPLFVGLLFHRKSVRLSAADGLRALLVDFFAFACNQD
jgi:hypothetical protein